MKKTYTKPEIMFEDFTLTSNIAASCAVKTYTPSSGECAYIVNDEFLGDIYFFTNDVSACTTTEADEDYNGICYHAPYDANLFNS